MVKLHVKLFKVGCGVADGIVNTRLPVIRYKLISVVRVVYRGVAYLFGEDYVCLAELFVNLLFETAEGIICIGYIVAIDSYAAYILSYVTDICPDDFTALPFFTP